MGKGVGLEKVVVAAVSADLQLWTKAKGGAPAHGLDDACGGRGGEEAEGAGGDRASEREQAGVQRPRAVRRETEGREEGFVQEAGQREPQVQARQAWERERQRPSGGNVDPLSLMRARFPSKSSAHWLSEHVASVTIRDMAAAAAAVSGTAGQERQRSETRERG